jgi:hypothetical protein
VKHTIYTVVLELAPHLSPELLEQLFEQIKKMPTSEYDKEALIFIQNFTTVSLRHSSVSETHTLWSLTSLTGEQQELVWLEFVLAVDTR